MAPKDPMLVVTPPNARELFNRMSSAADGFSSEDTVNAALNVLINALRQAYPTREKALGRLNELEARTREVLMSHYDSTGRKKGLFPYPQFIQATPFVEKNKF